MNILVQHKKENLENCTTIGTERGYWIGNHTTMINCKGDANYGPLMFVEGNNVDVELIVDSAESDRLVHSLITILGENNKVVLKNENGEKRQKEIPVLIGYTSPMHGESMSRYSQAKVSGLNLINKTRMPMFIGEMATNNTIKTNGKVKKNKGINNNNIIKIK